MSSKTEVLKEISRHLSTVGSAEFELAWKRTDLAKAASLTEQVQLIKDAIHAFREPHIPANAVFTSEVWRQLYNDINDFAARELSRSVDDRISALEEEKAHIEASLVAERAEVNRKYNEFDRIKQKADKLKADLAGFAAARVELSTAEADYESLFEARCLGRNVDTNAFLGLAEILVTRPIKLKVIERIEAKAKAGIVSLQKRNKELAKELNLEPHAI
jgi:hypothetical protein